MSDSWHHARALAARLEEELPEDASVDSALQARLELTVARALERRRANRTRRRAGFGAGAVLLAVAAAGLLLLREPLREHRQQPIAHGASATPSATLLHGELVREDGTPEEHTRLAPGGLPGARLLRSGPATLLQLAPSSQVELRHALVVVESLGKTASFVLESGSLGANASGTDESIVVRVADLRIEGQAAELEVERAGSECGGPVVRTRRGHVTVSTPNEHRVVAPGTSWSSCPAGALQASAAGSASSPSLPRVAPASSLQEQNDALAAAVAARRSGRTVEALRLYGAFVKRWPSGPLAEVARADRMNLLATQNPAAARRAAEEYLRQHPHGPARDRALTLTEQKLGEKK